MFLILTQGLQAFCRMFSRIFCRSPSSC